MLYERWRQVARARAREWALRELASGRSWTFAQLADAAESLSSTPRDMVFPHGAHADFILQTLAAWREQAVLCPLEPGATGVSIPHLPPGTVHVKRTSATTGASRLIAFTGEQLAADAENIVATMGLRPEWPNLAAISLAHSYGFSNLVLPLLLHGIPLVLLDSPLPETVKRALADLPGATVAAVPALWRTWHDAHVLTPSIRLAISAGAPLGLPLEKSVFDAGGLKIHNFYGASECGGIAYDRSLVPRTDDSCVGQPMENVTLNVGPTGCLEVRGGAVGQGYVPEAGPQLQNGCHRTSDLAEIRDGAVFLRGRASDLINVAGRKISPETIERALEAHPNVQACLVFGVAGADAGRGDLMVACVVLSAGTAEAELKQFLLSRMPAWQVPREWHVVASLETNERGKLSRAQWRSRLGYDHKGT